MTGAFEVVCFRQQITSNSTLEKENPLASAWQFQGKLWFVKQMVPCQQLQKSVQLHMQLHGVQQRVLAEVGYIRTQAE